MLASAFYPHPRSAARSSPSAAASVKWHYQRRARRACPTLLTPILLLALYRQTPIWPRCVHIPIRIRVPVSSSTAHGFHAACQSLLFPGPCNCSRLAGASASMLYPIYFQYSADAPFSITRPSGTLRGTQFPRIPHVCPTSPPVRKRLFRRSNQR